MIKNAIQPDSLMTWMGSLADPTRLRVLRLLEKHELGVVDLCDVLQMPQSTVSRHLKVLTDTGWLDNRRSGTTNFYRMALDRMEIAERKLWQLAREQTEGWATLGQDQLRLARLLSRRDQDAESFFAGAAVEWDKLREELYGKRIGFDAMLAMLPSEWVVADLGCGTGSLAMELSHHVKQVIGVDQSQPMLKAAKKRTESLTNVDLRRGSILSLPIEDGACDAAMFMLVLTYIPDPQAAIAEAVRILKPGGRLVVADLLRHDRDDFRRQMGQQVAGFEPAVMNGMLASAALTDVRIRPLEPEPQARGPALFVASGVRKKAGGN